VADLKGALKVLLRVARKLAPKGVQRAKLVRADGRPTVPSSPPAT